MTKNVIAALAVAEILTGTACRSATPAVHTPQASTPGPAAATMAAKTLPDSLRWVHDSAEYRALVVQTFRVASASIATAASGHEPNSWAVVLDADETIISNLRYQIERAQAQLPYTAESWRAWVARREATPLPGAADFLARVRHLGGRIAIVTNRLESECSDTEALFKTHKLVYDVMLCRPDGGPSDKNSRFAVVAAGTTKAGGLPLDVLAFIGDNILDFPRLTQAVVKSNDAALEPFGTKFFMLPNPMYGSWQQ
jgi:5'-nucleotidase (lipoprotein e(P4) family)